MRMTDQSYYLRSPDEMSQLFREVPEAISNTLSIAERCEIDLRFKEYHLPEFPVPDGYTTESYLRNLCEEGLRWRYGDRADSKEIKERLDYELRIIHKMGFDAYFLIVWDLCQHAKKEGIWYNARGSAAGSIVAYALEITLVDPIQHGLIFERFLNPGRVSMPDIDLDFRDDRRAEMMEYCAHRYGDDKVASIITFGTMKARAAIRDVGRVKDIPLPEVDRVAKMIPAIPGKPVTIQQALEEVSDFKQVYESTPYLKDLIDTAIGMEGVVRNAGTHAAGVVVTDKPAVEYLPLHRPTGNTQDTPIKTVTQFPMSIIDAQGLLKVDFLGLATLTIMAKACDLICERHGVDYNLQTIPVDDPESFKLLGRGETAGVFQVEGAGMRRYLIDMKPTSLDHVIAMISLFRPGPMMFIPSYIRRMHDKEEVSYAHPKLEPIFKETYGIAVYQEQIMRAAVEIAGYTASEADYLRKAISKKKEKQLKKHSIQFVEGAVKNGIDRETAVGIFENWKEFARYGFNKSHAADYGVIAVQTAFLKAHYPVEYMTALLSVSLSDTNKVALYVADCRHMGIEVHPPSIQTSGWDFTIEDHPDSKPGIRFGLGAIKNVGQGPVETILEAREKGPFKDLNDFIQRVDMRKVGKRALESMIKVGALDAFGNRNLLLENMDRIMGISVSHFKAKDAGQMFLFGAKSGTAPKLNLHNTLYESNQRELLKWEKELIGLYVSDHPLTPVMDVITQNVSHFAHELLDAEDKQKVRVAGIVSHIRPYQTKKGDPMAFATIEDLGGNIDLVVFPGSWKKYRELIEMDKIIMVEGRVDANSAEPKILVDTVTTELRHVTPLEEIPDISRSSHDQIPSFNDDLAEESFDDENESGSGFDDNLTNNYSDDPVDFDGPPPPDAFAPGWEDMEPDFSTEPAKPNPSDKDNSPPPDGDNSPVIEEPAETESIPEVLEVEAGKQANPSDPVRIAEQREALQITPETNLNAESAPTEQILIDHTPEYIVSREKTPAKREDIRMLTIILRPTNDPIRDKLRIRNIFGKLISYPGRDRFAFHIFENGHNYLLEFPNMTTDITPELIAQIEPIVGRENLQIESIPIQ